MMTARMTEYETLLASAVAKTAALEKIKSQLQLDADSLIKQLDKVDIHFINTCKLYIKLHHPTLYMPSKFFREVCG